MAMKKSLFMVLMLAMAGVVSSCEKDPVSGVDPNAEISNVKNDESIAEFVGLWMRKAYTEGIGKSEYAWRFYEDKTGFLSVDQYNLDEEINGFTRIAFTYRVENGRLYMRYQGDVSDIVWDYHFMESSLHVKSDMDEMGVEYVFFKTEDASDELMGDWYYTTKSSDGRRVDSHLKFYTPMDGCTYDVVYTKDGTSIAERPYPTELKYRFDGEKVYMTRITSAGNVVEEYYYKMVGNNLYMGKSKSDMNKHYTKWEK
jgi:hypothetical protein